MQSRQRIGNSFFGAAGVGWGGGSGRGRAMRQTVDTIAGYLSDDTHTHTHEDFNWACSIFRSIPRERKATGHVRVGRKGERAKSETRTT